MPKRRFIVRVFWKTLQSQEHLMASSETVAPDHQGIEDECARVLPPPSNPHPQPAARNASSRPLKFICATYLRGLVDGSNVSASRNGWFDRSERLQIYVQFLLYPSRHWGDREVVGGT